MLPHIADRLREVAEGGGPALSTEDATVTASSSLSLASGFFPQLFS